MQALCVRFPGFVSHFSRLQESYTTVERIVDMQRGGEEEEFPDYYVKWKNLPYAGGLRAIQTISLT